MMITTETTPEKAEAPVTPAEEPAKAETAAETAEEAAAEKPAKKARKPIDPHAMLTVSTSPHIKSPDTTRSIMIDVLIALLPSFIWGIYLFGFRTLTITLVSVLAAVGAEAGYQKLTKKPITILDFSAAVTGVLVAFNMPASIPLWIPFIGSVFAIVVVKQLYGGIGKNFMNPALAARAFLMLAWPSEMTQTPAPFAKLSPFAISIAPADIVATATPMQVLKTGNLPDAGLFDLLIGTKSGCFGEVSALLLIAGGVFLLVRHVISWHIPVSYLLTVGVIAYIFPQTTSLYRWEFVACELICGGVMLGAIYMATDYATCPVTAKGRLLFGFGCGAITMFIRYFGGYNEGVTFAILIMNTLVWYIDILTKPRRFGGVTNGK